MKNKFRRDKVEIVANILGLVKSDQVKRTHIMYKCNLSFTQTRSYVDALTKAGLMAVDGGDYHITPQGEAILQDARELRRKMGPLYQFLEKEQSI